MNLLNIHDLHGQNIIRINQLQKYHHNIFILMITVHSRTNLISVLQLFFISNVSSYNLSQLINIQPDRSKVYYTARGPWGHRQLSKNSSNNAGAVEEKMKSDMLYCTRGSSCSIRRLILSLKYFAGHQSQFAYDSRSQVIFQLEQTM